MGPCDLKPICNVGCNFEKLDGIAEKDPKTPERQDQLGMVASR